MAHINRELVELSERDLRPAKAKLKMAGTSRDASGANEYARIQSFISTTKSINSMFLASLQLFLKTRKY